MNLIHTAIAFLFAICVLIVFHELGHYWVARLCNVKVLRFSLGMGKVIFSRRVGPDQTEWVISALPLGGYVKMLDLREQENLQLSKEDIQREFTSQSVWKRIAIVAAGPIANFILAIILFALVFMVGIPEPTAKVREPAVSSVAYQAGLHAGDRIVAVEGKTIELWSELRWELMQLALEKQSVSIDVISGSTTQNGPASPASRSHQPHSVFLSLSGLNAHDLDSDFLAKLGLNLYLSKAQLGHVMPDGAAMRAGLKEGDVVTQIDGKSIPDSLALIEIVRLSPNKPLNFTVLRLGNLLDISVTPAAVSDNGKSVGKLNVEVRSIPEMLNHQDAPLAAIQKAAQRTWATSILTVKMIGKMIIGEVSVKNITGPLTIADYAGQTAQSGWISYVSFLAFISISLGVMNLLPIPILDGGHLLYYSLEVLSGRPVPVRYWEIAQRAGLAILMLLMVLAFFNDIVRLFPA